MLWLIKAALIIIYFSYTAIHYKLSILKKLFIPVIIISMPVFRSDTVNYEKMIALGLITTLLMLSLKFSKYIFTGMAVIVIATSVLYFNGILGTNLHLDSGRTIMVDAGYASRINQLRSQSLFLP